MEFSAADVIRVSSAALYLLLGIGIMVVGRRRPGPLALGGLLVCFGGYTNLNNFGPEGGGPLWPPLFDVLVAGVPVFSVLVALFLPRPVRGREWWAFAGGMAVGFATFASLWDSFNADSPLHFIGSFYSYAQVGMFATVALRLALKPPMEGRAYVRAAALMLAMAPYLLFRMPDDLGFGAPTMVAMLFLVCVLSGAWLVATARSGVRHAGLFALFWPALGAFSYGYWAFTVGRDVWGVHGLVRLLGWSVLMYAILRADLLGVRLPRIVVTRGAVAAGALATLFIVAQVAQNFLSAEYGLLTGGVIAGAVLFIASPIQRTFERIGERNRPSTRAPTPAGKQHEETFRDAARLAFKDRRFDENEEVALARLADRMGVSAERAVALRHAVEREKGVR